MRDRLITFTQQNSVSRFELRQIFREMGFGFMDVQLYHDQIVAYIVNSVKGMHIRHDVLFMS